MRKTVVLFIMIIATSIAVKAQGNLQFNQVIRSKYTATYTGQGITGTTGSFTVPAGKVWKIESISSTGNLTLDGQAISNATSSGGGVINTTFPIWFGAGTYTIFINNSVSNLGTYTFSSVLDGIEFNIVP